MVINLFEIFKIDGLLSRDSGEKVRKLMDDAFQRGEVVTLNFDNIKFVSIGWADEVVGIYTEAFGVEFVKKNIKTTNARHNIRTILNLAVQSRKY